MASHVIFRGLPRGILKLLSCEDYRTGKGYTTLSGGIQLQYGRKRSYNICQRSLNDLWRPYWWRLYHRCLYVRLAHIINRQFRDGRSEEHTSELQSQSNL